MIETFSDLAKLLDDGWRITGIRADSDGERQRFRFEVEAVKADHAHEEFHAGVQRRWAENMWQAIGRMQADHMCDWGGCSLSAEERHPYGNYYCAKHMQWRKDDDQKKHPPAITPEGWEIGSGFAEFLHSVGHGNLDTELRDLEDAR